MEGVPQPYLGDLLTMVINNLLTGMILQVDLYCQNRVIFSIVCVHFAATNNINNTPRLVAIEKPMEKGHAFVSTDVSLLS